MDFLPWELVALCFDEWLFQLTMHHLKLSINSYGLGCNTICIFENQIMGPWIISSKTIHVAQLQFNITLDTSSIEFYIKLTLGELLISMQMLTVYFSTYKNAYYIFKKLFIVHKKNLRHQISFYEHILCRKSQHNILYSISN